MCAFPKLLAAGIIVLMLSGQALAGENLPIYIGAKLGVSAMTADDVENTTDVSNPATVNNTSEDDTLTALGLAAGFNWKEMAGVPLRTEIEYMYRSEFSYEANPTFKDAGAPTKVDVDMTVQTLLVNLFLDIPTDSALTPYVGGGLGWAFLESDCVATVLATGDTADRSNEETNLAWHVGGGLAYAINENWTADLGYRYIDFGSMEWGRTAVLGLKADEITAHEVLLGIRYTF
ncbi:MAG: outer membrane beta-barrel protein [Thermodesulfobacteriota bacterium]